MLAVGVQSEDKCETNRAGGVVKETAESSEEIRNEPQSVAVKGYQFKADGKTLDIPFTQKLHGARRVSLVSGSIIHTKPKDEQITTKQAPRDLIVYWLEEIIIGLELCPFAKIPYKNGLVRIKECEAETQIEQVEAFLDELEHLQQTPSSKLSTTILVYTKNTENFLDFSDFVGLCEELLEEAGLLEHFQLVVFHPGFYFEGANPDEIANYVNRSPFPTIHLLRNAEIEMAKARSDGMDVSEKNRVMLNALDKSKVEKLFYYL